MPVPCRAVYTTLLAMLIDVFFCPSVLCCVQIGVAGELEHTLLDSRFPKEMDLAAGDMSWKNFKAQATWSPHDAP